MCGRVACTLCSESTSEACCYPRWNKGELQYVRPKYIHHATANFIPSYNIYPTQDVTVLVHKSHFPDVEGDTEYIVTSMRWGLKPNFKIDAPLHNARIENIDQSRVFRPEVNKNHRCVIVCDGFYEWQATRKEKQPYFIFLEKIASESSITDGKINGIDWLGKAVMKLAGVFSIQKDEETGKNTYHCSVITTEADLQFSKIHSRMPVCLKTVKDVEMWINTDTTCTESLKFLHDYVIGKTKESEVEFTYKYKWYAVEKKFVNNTKCTTEECIKPISHKHQGTLDSWFGTNKRKSTTGDKEYDNNEGGPCTKKRPSTSK